MSLLTTNEHPVERVLRVVLVLGLGLRSAAALGSIGAWVDIGVVPLLTGLIGNCPLDSVFGATCPVDRGAYLGMPRVCGFCCRVRGRVLAAIRTSLSAPEGLTRAVADRLQASRQRATSD